MVPDSIFSNQTPNIPFFTMGYDGYLHGLFGSPGKGATPVDLLKGYDKVNDLLKGTNFQLLLKQNYIIK